MIKHGLQPFLQIFLENQANQKQLFNLANFILKSAKQKNFADNFNIDVKKMSWKDISFGGNISEDVAKKYLSSFDSDKKINLELENLNKNQIKTTSFFDENYPCRLKQIANPPFFLFHRGEINNDFWKFAIVGARKGSQYSKMVVENIVPELILSSATIVSGGADGVDTFAHEATLKARGKTIVVVGSGLGCTYPSKNKDLFQKVVSGGGCELSIFPFETPPNKINFPIRNRVISGMAEGVLVVEASIKSGSLITANFGLEENREVFAIPGPINSSLSQGCNKLLKDGAILVQEPKDILDVFAARTDLKEYIKNQSSNKSVGCEIKLTALESKIFNEVNSNKPAELFNKKPNDLLFLLKNAKNMDELINETGRAEEDLLNHLFDLSMENKIEQSFDGSWKLSAQRDI